MLNTDLLQRSSSPSISVPRLDLTKVKPYDKKPLLNNSLMVENVPVRQTQTISYDQPVFNITKFSNGVVHQPMI